MIHIMGYYVTAVKRNELELQVLTVPAPAPPRHLMMLQEMPPHGPVRSAFSPCSALCSSKGLLLWAEAAQVDQNGASKWHLCLKKSTHPLQLRGKQDTWLRSKTHFVGVSALSDSSAQWLNCTDQWDFVLLLALEPYLTATLSPPNQMGGGRGQTHLRFTYL